MDSMSLADASFLYAENETDLHHNAWLGIFEGPPPTTEEYTALIAAKLHLIPRYRQRVRFVPGDLGTPVWVDDQHFNLGFHIRHIALPAPGSDDQLRHFFTTLMAMPLDRGKPLWEMWVIDGLEKGRWAVVSKLHHCMADGATTTGMTTILFDADSGASIAEPPPWAPGPAPTDQELVQAALASSQQTGENLTTRYAVLMSSLRQRGDEVGAAFTSLESSLAEPLDIPELNGPIGPYRRWGWVQAPLADIAKVRKRLGGTVNDVILAMVTNGFRELLLARGEQVTGRTVRCMVPVSVRDADDEAGNRVSAMYAELPVGVSGVLDRYSRIRTQMDALKAANQALAGDVLASFAALQSPALAALGARAASQVTSPVNTTTTNVPGPQFPLYALGRLMLENWPYITLANTVRIATTAFSYNGVVRLGVTGDHDSTADLEVFTEGVRKGLSGLQRARARSAARGEPVPPPTEPADR